MGQVGWTLESSPMPMSGGHQGHGTGGPAGVTAADSGGPRPIGLDRAVAIFDGLGIARGYAVDLPKGGTGVYTASVFPKDLAAQRIIHLDQYSGRPLVDLRVADYGAGARAIEWGINVHTGQEFGLANRLLMLAACVAIVLMSAAAAVMWWKRRPRGSLGAPPLPDDPRLVRGLLAVMVAAGIAFPLTGLSLLVALALDRLLLRPSLPNGSPAKADARQQLLEPRIRPHGIPCRAQQDGRVEAGLVGLGQPGHRLVVIPEAHVDEGDAGVGGGVALLPGHHVRDDRGRLGLRPESA